jgi:hypothetical protein
MPTKTLLGSIQIDAAGTYDLVAPTSPQLQTVQQAEVFINCDMVLAAGIVTLNLPSISTLGGFNAKVHVVDTTGGATANDIVIVANLNPVPPPAVAVPDTIEGAASVTISTDFQSVTLQPVANKIWATS